MPHISVRDVPSDVIENLKREAAKNGRSMEAEVRSALADKYRDDWSEFQKISARFREETRGRSTTPSEDLIREMRDSR